MRRFLADDLSADEVVLDKESSHHLLRVTGIGPGEAVELVDGLGGHAAATLLSVERGRARLLIKDRLSRVIRKDERILVTGLLRASVFDQVIRQATELGVDRIVPVQADRSVAKSGNPERWHRVARAALIQCGRSLLPEIDPVGVLDPVLASLEGVRLVFLSPGHPALQSVIGRTAVFVGPEGGWSSREMDLALTRGAQFAGFGDHVLRAETAVVAALARL
jgi:16S rRNA (uracil1498-N3)-methyltransferase